jgi:DNA polymerase I-like protein with 3'-5' exonuclease and polymerase domains
MVKSIKPRKQVLNPNQIPLIVPDSPWVRPTELPDLTRVGDIAWDTENLDNGLIKGRGPGWAFRNNRDVGGWLAGVSAAWREGNEVKSIYVPVEHPESDCFDKDAVARWVRAMFKRKRGRNKFCNAGYDLGWMNTEFDLEIPDGSLIDDIGCQAMMIDENRKAKPGFQSAFSLDGIADWLGIPGKDERLLRDAAFSYGYQGKEVKKYIAKLPSQFVGPYAEADAVATFLADEKMMPIVHSDSMTEAYQTEMDLVPVIHHMRKKGVRLNEERCAQLGDRLMARYEANCRKITEITKMQVSIDELRDRNWLIRTCDMNGIDEYKKEGEDGGAEAGFTKDWMRASKHPIVRHIAEAKQCHEAATKFVQAYLLNSVYRGRIHANINQFKSEDGGTRSHRFSYSEPPLQQMPSRPDPVEGWDITEEIARELRMSFEPEEGELWFAPDYSQQEYRLIVHYAYLLECGKAEEAVRKYNEDPKTDFHNLVVEMTGLTRRRAKDVNFAKAYGAGVKKFALMTGMSEEEAAQVMGQYDGEMPFVKELNEVCQREAQSRGYIRMIDGARSHFDDWEPRYLDNAERRRGFAQHYQMAPCRREEANVRVKLQGHPWFGKLLKRADTRKAMNRLIQGSAARQVKKAMVACWRAGYRSMLLQIHDELAFSLTKEKDGKAIGEIMREVIKLKVPMRVDEEYGTTWGTAKYAFADARKAGKGLAPALAA